MLCLRVKCQKKCSAGELYHHRRLRGSERFSSKSRKRVGLGHQFPLCQVNNTVYFTLGVPPESLRFLITFFKFMMRNESDFRL